MVQSILQRVNVVRILLITASGSYSKKNVFQIIHYFDIPETFILCRYLKGRSFNFIYFVLTLFTVRASSSCADTDVQKCMRLERKRSCDTAGVTTAAGSLHCIRDSKLWSTQYIYIQDSISAVYKSLLDFTAPSYLVNVML